MAEWLSKLRKVDKYWKINNEGKRYSALRKAKNRQEGHEGKYVIKEISKRTGMPSATIERIERGVVEGMAQMAPLLQDLDISETDFYRMGPAPTAASPTPIQASVPAPAAAPAPKAPKTVDAAPKAEVKSSPRNGSTMEVVNCSPDALFVRVEAGKIYIFPNEASYAKKGTFVGGADEIAGMAPRPRSTVVPVG